MDRGGAELELARSGYGSPLTVAFSWDDKGLLAATPVDAGLRADPAQAPERSLVLVAAAVSALVTIADASPPRSASDLRLTLGETEGRLLLAYPARAGRDEAELAAAAFDEEAATLDRLRVRAAAVPPAVLPRPAELRPPIGDAHPLRVMEVVARLGGRPVSTASVDEHEERALAVLNPAADVAVAHRDPNPDRRMARRILQRLAGMGKWGGYHTNFDHLSRGFRGDDKARAADIGELLLRAGLLGEKQSVGQRHVFLNPRRSGDIMRLVESGEVPADPLLARLRD